MNSLQQQQLLRAQQRMKSQADKKRSERTFSVGNHVYLKLQPYMQQSIEARGNQKLSFKFCGPYKVIQRVGEVAYKLQLPPASQIHPVVHVSQLKRHVPANSQVSVDTSVILSDLCTTVVPEQILQQALVPHGAAMAPRILVRWSGPVHSLTTWEDADDLCRRYPRAPAWGQAMFEEEGNVTNLTRAPTESSKGTSDGLMGQKEHGL